MTTASYYHGLVNIIDTNTLGFPILLECASDPKPFWAVARWGNEFVGWVSSNSLIIILIILVLVCGIYLNYGIMF